MKHFILWAVGAVVLVLGGWYLFTDRTQAPITAPEPLPPLVVKDFEGEADPSKMTLIMKPWNWISAKYNDGKEVKPRQAGKFVLSIAMNRGTFGAVTDCNSLGGHYTLDAVDKSKIQFDSIVGTQMFCEGSQEGEFVKLLENIGSYHFTSKGELIFDLKFDSGVVVFR